jgi:hypothetical protein
MDTLTNKDQEGKDSIKGILLLLFLLLVFIFMFLNNTDNEDSKEEVVKANVKMFNDGEALICSTSPFKYSVKYQVSKSRGWQIQRDSFAKGDMLIGSGACNKSLPITKGGK